MTRYRNGWFESWMPSSPTEHTKIFKHSGTSNRTYLRLWSPPPESSMTEPVLLGSNSSKPGGYNREKLRRFRRLKRFNVPKISSENEDTDSVASTALLEFECYECNFTTTDYSDYQTHVAGHTIEEDPIEFQISKPVDCPFFVSTEDPCTDDNKPAPNYSTVPTFYSSDTDDSAETTDEEGEVSDRTDESASSIETDETDSSIETDETDSSIETDETDSSIETDEVYHCNECNGVDFLGHMFHLIRKSDSHQCKYSACDPKSVKHLIIPIVQEYIQYLNDN